MRTLSGARGGLFSLSQHASERIAQRFGITHPAEQALWLIEQIAQATRLSCNLSNYYTTAPRLLWACADGVRLISDGNEIITVWRDGEPDEEGQAIA